ncbi:IclR family transcriptional regulator [Nonomuraea angiospora]|uniref:DNA-binding IclR family transcriptional regulator n=1 Tax=Nonomuraea angiospora TaxID=46172 RepID=A0ABR9LPL6_9ACTN|nr:IclR family transcriptional regulator [Nonomuraea angiospora]MBE1582223.1 DNA-binding IclR family transcriptional regulator [Nonomuraea angiospora]
MTHTAPPRPAIEDNEDGSLQTLLRGLDVLQAVAHLGGQATAKSLSRQLDLSLGRCYHILRTLKAGGYIVRLPGGRVDIGPHGASLGRQLGARFEPLPELFAVLARLHARTRETSYVSGWHHGVITLLQFIAGEQALGVGGLDVGYTGDLHARASCKAVLAHLPRGQIDIMFRGVELRRLTAHTHSDVDSLTVELSNIRRQGFALDLEEFSEGICCASAAYFDHDGAPAGSYTVSVPVTRFRTTQRELIAAVQEAAAIATNLLRGHHPAVPGRD